MLAFRHPLQLTKSRNRKTMKILFSWFQIEDKVLRSYTSGDFSCFEGV